MPCILLGLLPSCWRIFFYSPVAAGGAVDAAHRPPGWRRWCWRRCPTTSTDEAPTAVVPRRPPTPRRSGLPVMVLLFMFFPRIAPLWGAAEQIRRTGLSQLGSGAMNEVANDDAIAPAQQDRWPLLAPDARFIRDPVLSVLTARPGAPPTRPADAWRRQPGNLRTDGRPLRLRADAGSRCGIPDAAAAGEMSDGASAVTPTSPSSAARPAIGQPPADRTPAPHRRGLPVGPPVWTAAGCRRP